MFDFIVNVQVAVVRDGKYLFIVRGAEESFLPGAKGLPGGKVEHCESPDRVLEETGAREVLEETGVTVAQDPVYVRSSTFTANGKYVVNVVFMAQWKSGEPYANSPGEVSDCLWLSADDVAADTDIPEWEQINVRKAELIRLDMGGDPNASPLCLRRLDPLEPGVRSQDFGDDHRAVRLLAVLDHRYPDARNRQS